MLTINKTIYKKSWLMLLFVIPAINFKDSTINLPNHRFTSILTLLTLQNDCETDKFNP